QRSAGTPYAPLADVTEADREAAERELAAGGREVERLFAAARAIGHDPSCEPARARLRALLERFGGDAAATIAAAARAHDARPALVLAEADELLAAPELCDAIAAIGAGDPVTVAIAIDDARFAELVPALEVLLAGRGLDGDEGADLLAFPCPPAVVQQLPEGTVAAIVTATPRRGAIPCFGAADGAALRELVARPAVAAA
ncbi:MAG TPA: hypothetical protein VHB30_10065, partial [Solirubrobacteraceae bacterium]|nr:hypothetical protein [Solirubrobacteraceae bacterium]